MVWNLWEMCFIFSQCRCCRIRKRSFLRNLRLWRLIFCSCRRVYVISFSFLFCAAYVRWTMAFILWKKSLSCCATWSVSWLLRISWVSCFYCFVMVRVMRRWLYFVLFLFFLPIFQVMCLLCFRIYCPEHRYFLSFIDCLMLLLLCRAI